MQNLALLLLLAITTSTIFAFDGVFAQEAEAPEVEITEEEIVEATEDEVMEDESIEEGAVEDNAEVMEDEMGAIMMDDDIPSPRQQLMSGTDPHEIQCTSGMNLVFKATNFHPACVKESSYQVLLQRGWVSDHDPSHEELAGLIAGLPTSEETLDEETEDEEIVMEEDIETEEDTTTGNGTEITSQSYTIELSEAMEMGAN